MHICVIAGIGLRLSKATVAWAHPSADGKAVRRKKADSNIKNNNNKINK